MNQILTNNLKTSIGELILGSFDGQLCLCDWRFRKMRLAINKRLQDGLSAIFVEGESPVISMAAEQINEFLAGERLEFDLPILMVGTQFQKSVWEQLMKIPYGKTETYLGLSKKLGKEKAIRAVAAANGANAISLIIPCHRVIGSNGELVGYAGGLPAKNKLLNLESDKGFQQQTSMF
jgi:methylated-DNA-[protein]-cysteine S-methyltransferase